MKNTHPILYSFVRCPYAMRARLAIAASGQTVELREVVLKDKPESMMSYSPKGTVPVLVLSDGTVIDESLDVMKWALQQNDPDGWLEQMGTDLVEENDSTFKMHLDKYKYFTRHPEHTKEVYREHCEVFLKKLEVLLSKNEFLTGDQMKFADAAILPFVRQFAKADIEWFQSSKYKNTQRWLEHFLQSPLLEQVMTKYEQWSVDDTPVLFP
ncbi:glutathione S-transferase [Candidatus Uhrbacteria bacterium]|jgi:glutathione S-transferase|nr:glutathione S-transferase [Candidatus Uhrbacteria bacterium]